MQKCERSGDICIAVNDNYNDCVNQYDVWKRNAAGKLLVSDSDLQQRAVHEQCLLFSVNAVHVMITFVSNLVYAGIFVWVLTRMFNSEKIMFSK